MRFKLINLNRYLADGNSLNLEFPSVFYPPHLQLTYPLPFPPQLPILKSTKFESRVTTLKNAQRNMITL